MFLHRLRTIGRRQLYTGADATLMEAALNLCEWKLKHNIKTAAFERLSKLLKKHMLPKDGSELTEAWYQVEQSQNVPGINKYIVHCCPCDVHRYGHSLDVGGANYAVDMFEGTGPVCTGVAVEPGTPCGPATWPDCEIVHEKPETRRHVVFKHKTWDEHWVPTDEYGEHAILQDMRAEVEQHDYDVYVWEVLSFLEVIHTSPSVPDLTLAVCRLHAAGRMALTAPCRVFAAAHATKDNAVLSDVFDECWPRDTRTGVPYPLKKTPRFPIAAPPYIEQICYATFNYRAAGYTTANHIYAKETVMAAFREYTPPSSQPHCDHPCGLYVRTVHLVMYMEQGNLRNYLARYYFKDEGKDGQGGREKGTLPGEDGLAKAPDLAAAWQQSLMGTYYQAGKCPPLNVMMFKDSEEKVCEETPH
eukprot:jgi/Tetstr1/457499/TSEL_044080.t1